MISIKRYLDGHAPIPEELPDPLLGAALECYGAALRAVGHSTAEACPATGRELEEGLEALYPQLAESVGAGGLREVERLTERLLARWGVQTSLHLKSKADEVKELLIMLARTAENVGERDQRYTSQFSGLTNDLKAVANLEDITQVRHSVLKKAAELKTFVDAMAEDGRQSREAMQARISEYEDRLRKAEELASKDPLTGLANRRGIESRMQWWAGQERTFSVIMLDLNRFKELNDKHGHQAGDDLLRHFAAELMSHVRAEDMVGRWGGDEFVLLVGRERHVAGQLVERVRQWVFGEYTVRTGRMQEGVKVRVEAAVGIAEWTPGTSVEELMRQADAAMYDDKRSGRKLTA